MEGEGEVTRARYESTFLRQTGVVDTVGGVKNADRDDRSEGH